MMRARGCPHESDVLDLAAMGQWPDRADAALRDHVTGCAVCADVAAVASVLAAGHAESLDQARVPDASLVWYRAAWRAREASTRRALRPLTVVHVAALACIAAVVIMGASAGLAWLAASWHATRDLVSGPVSSVMTLGQETLGSAGVWLAAMAVAWVVLIPLAFSLARLADRTSDTQTE
ncbi:MAG TPA: hypothetical protein VHD57_14070 [Vicinamibacterales bacterium]|jgi:hypothetical protein|nr:hypothetical protein [Vicinamibacterales bacterium]